MRQVSVGLGLHRPEMPPLMAESMRRYDAVFLEEPPTPGFDQMLRGDSIQYHVYRAERAATGALLASYQCAAAGSFDETLAAVIHFARADAARFRWRDSLRAQALAALIPAHRSSYDESGLIHYQLGWKNKKSYGDPGAFPHLRDELACTATVRRLSLDDCRRLFPLLRTASSLEARQRVAAYLAASTLAGQIAAHLPG